MWPPWEWERMGCGPIVQSPKDGKGGVRVALSPKKERERDCV